MTRFNRGKNLKEGVSRSGKGKGMGMVLTSGEYTKKGNGSHGRRKEDI